MAEGMVSLRHHLWLGAIGSVRLVDPLSFGWRCVRTSEKDRYHDGLLTADEVREMNLWGQS